MQNRFRQLSFIMTLFFIVAPALGMQQIAGKKRPCSEEMSTEHDNARQRTQGISKEEEFFQKHTDISFSFKTKIIFLTITSKDSHDAGKLICHGHSKGFSLPKDFQWSTLLKKPRNLVVIMTKATPQKQKPTATDLQ